MTILARMLGPLDYGQYAWIVATYVFAISLGCFGMEARTLINLGAGDTRFASEMFFLRVLSALTTALLMVLILSLSDSFRLGLSGALLMSSALVFRAIAQWARVTLTALNKAHRYTAAVTCGMLLEVICGSALVLSGQGLIYVLAVHALAWFVIAIVSARVCLLVLREDFFMPKIARVFVIGVQGLKTGAIAILDGLILTAPILFLGWTANSERLLAELALPYNLANVLLSVSYPFFSAALPYFAGLATSSKPLGDKYVWGVVLLAFCLSTGAWVAEMVIGEALLISIFGEEYWGAAETLSHCILNIGLLLAPMGHIHRLLLAGKELALLICNLTCVVVLFSLLMGSVDELTVDCVVDYLGVAWCVRAVLIAAVSEWVKLVILGKAQW